MTISSSLNAGVAGLSSNASKLASISQNIANSSTYGYKRVETDFHSVVIAGSGGAYAAGGVRASTQQLVDQKGTLINTTNATDIAVKGNGMIPVMQAAQLDSGQDPTMFLTSTGSFRADGDGYLRSESGLVLLGWPADADGTVPSYPRDTSTGLEPMRITSGTFSAEPTTEIEIALNLPSTNTEAGSPGDPSAVSIEYYDNLGAPQSLEFSFSPTVPGTGSSNEWTMTITDNALAGATVGEYVMTFNDSTGDGGTLAGITTTSGGAYDASTGILQITSARGPIDIDIGRPGDADGMTQLAGAFAPVTINKDGVPVGNMISVEIDDKGFVNGVFDTGITRTLYQIPLVDLPNPNGMLAMDSQVYLPTAESGSFFLLNAGEGSMGEFVSFAREQSTTDVAGELTDLIQTQRAYSSNAKVIQTVDEMLQETTNIKR
ncbi:flagellar hook protein FlgE [Poseidonocella sedimentorum]|uniref:Flagellar hook protein FlgE n=1 Tax=Poseidonocella sedimentorum TaxID=871652 RepID=A0A1I6D604_9RHOB|nr:flagellar hook-basal body complex protein [Poseidonocella sedimentorum]SFR00781.1 flagellar hook protein FlgE [Poseidonocella sedimentorum]